MESKNLKIFLNLKFDIIVSVAVAVLLFVFGTLYDLIVNISGKTPNEIVWIALSDSLTDPGNPDFWLNIIIIVYSTAVGVYALIAYSKLRYLVNIRKAERGDLRYFLMLTAWLMALGRFNRAIYLLFKTDFIIFWDSFGQIYIFLDVMAMCIFLNIAADIFYSGDLREKTVFAVLNTACVVITFVAAIFTMVYAADRPFFTRVAYIPLIVQLVIFSLSMAMALRINRVRARFPEYGDSLIFLEYQLVAFAVSIILLIGTGITNPWVTYGNYLPNRILRILRIAALNVAVYGYFRAFIAPATARREKVESAAVPEEE